MAIGTMLNLDATANIKKNVITTFETNQSKLEKKCSLLEDWGAINVSAFVSDHLGEYLPDVVEDIRQSCIRGEYPKADLMASWKNKGGTWFKCLMRLHFSGRPTESYTDSQLGLTDSGGTCGEHAVYSAVLEKIREHHGIRSFEDYKKFMNWLINIDLHHYPVQKINDSLHPSQKVIRFELCKSCSQFDEDLRIPYDPNNTGLEYFNFHIKYPARFIYFKFHLIRIILGESNPSFVSGVINEWLHSAECAPARDWLFTQRYYPLNTFFNECYPWNVLIEPLTKLCPEVLSNYDEEFIEDLQKESAIQLTQRDLPEFFNLDLEER